jgi:predicted RNase H-like HicB family nuclease
MVELSSMGGYSVVRRDEGGSLIAEVPELQGCVAFGHSEAELQANLRTAVADYLELFGT